MNSAEYERSEHLLQQVRAGVSDEQDHAAYYRAMKRLKRWTQPEFMVLADQPWLQHIMNGAAGDVSHWESVCYHRRMMDQQDEAVGYYYREPGDV